MNKEKYGRLTIKGMYKKNGHIYCSCICDCGNKKDVRKDHLLKGLIISCGCFHKERMSKLFTESNVTHGLSRTRLYKVFRDMKTRCYNSHSPDYKNYGARGIQICEEWLNDYTKFAKWAIENGYDENAKKMYCTIDRIDVNGNYEPNNCRWVGAKIQNKNKRRRLSKYDVGYLNAIREISYLPIKEIGKKIGISENQIRTIMRYYKTSIKKLRKEI